MADTLILSREKKIKDCKCPYCKENSLVLRKRDEEHYVGGDDYGLKDGFLDVCSVGMWSSLNWINNAGDSIKKSYIECINCRAKFDYKYEEPKKIRL
jgi:hypothetical protein